MKPFYITLFLMFFFCIKSFTQPEPILTAFPEKAASYMDAISKVGLFSGTILVAQKDQVLFQKGYGWASRRFSIPNDASTKFRAGSVTKSLTAIAILQLVEQNKLSLEHPLSRYLPEYPFASQIKIKHLLSHTSGIKRDIKFEEGRNYTLKELIELAKVDSLLYTPGTKMSYSNCAYVLLHYILEKVSGQNYETYLSEKILQPLGLKNTGIEFPLLPPQRLADGFSPGVDQDGNYAIREVHMKSHGYSNAVGALYATASDLWQFCRQIGKHPILERESWTLALQPFDAQSKGYTWGYGFNISESNGLKVINHNGRITGFRGGYFYYPDWDLTIIVLANNSYAERGPIVDAFEKMLLGEDYYQPKAYPAVELEENKLNDYTGTYKTAQFEFEIFRKGQQLFLTSHGDPPSKIHPFAKEAFFCEYFDLKLYFKRENGKITSCEWRYLDEPMEAERQ